MMDICACMVRQQRDGSEMCVRCHGDIYACECPLRHTVHCEHFVPTPPEPIIEDIEPWMVRSF